MLIQKKVFGFILLAGGFFVLWAMTGDSLLLSLWIMILLLLEPLFSGQSTQQKPFHSAFFQSRVLTAGSIFSERLEIKNNSHNSRYLLQIEDQSDILSEIHSRAISRLGAGRNSCPIHQSAGLSARFLRFGADQDLRGRPFWVLYIIGDVSG